MIRTAILGFMTGAVVLVVLCVAPRAQGKGPDACTVVAKGEIEQMFGVKLQDGANDTPAAGTTPVFSSCTFFSADGQSSISLGLRHDPPSLRANEKAGVVSMKPRAITGVGTEAFVIDVAGMGTQLTAYRGQRDALQAAVSIAGRDAKATQAGLEKVAKLVFERWK